MPSLRAALTTYLQVDRADATNGQYERVLTQLITAIGPDREVQLVSYEDLVDYFSKEKARGLKQSTRYHKLAVIKTFFAWCVERGYCPASPAAAVYLRKPTADPDRVKAIPPAELRQMVEAVRYHPRNYAMLLFLVDTGCRVGSLVQLQIQHLDTAEGWAQVPVKGGGWLKVRFGDQTAKALKRWLRRRPPAIHDYVWTGKAPHYNPLTERGAAAMIRRLAEKVEASYHWGPHAIRHAFGQAHAHAGTPLTVTSKLMGHSSPQVTARYYYPDGEADLEEAARRNRLAALEDHDPPPPKIVKRQEVG